MERRGGRRSTTWKKGENPVKKKGQISRATKMKQAMGLENWEGLVQYIEGRGATKLVQEMQKLKGRDFVNAVSALAEYIKPKLSRVDAKVKGSIDFTNATVKFK
jgi:hypothetical protein